MRLILASLVLFLLYRLGNFITVPYLFSAENITNYLSVATNTGVINQQALQRMSLFSLGIIPYITSGIIVQLFKFVFVDTNYGIKLKNKDYLSSQTILITLLIATIQSYFFVSFSISENQTYFNFATATLLLIAGCFIMVWFAKIITKFGLGNGASILIMISIIEHFSLAGADILSSLSLGQISIVSFFSQVLYVLILFSLISYIELSFRPVKLLYPTMQNQNSYYKKRKTDVLPFKINNSGVLPLIFAMSFSALLSTSVMPYFYNNFGVDMTPLATIITLTFIIFFVAYYTPFVINTQEISDNLKKSNIIADNHRPGVVTKRYLDGIISKLNIVAVFYLSSMALVPDILVMQGINVIITGISAVILVVVIVDMIKRIQYMSYSNKFKMIVN